MNSLHSAVATLRRHAAVLICLGLPWLVLGASAPSQVTARVTVNSSGRQGNDGGVFPTLTSSVVSTDGRFIAFMSNSTNFDQGDVNGVADIYLRDRISGTTELLSRATTGYAGNGISGRYGISMSPEGRYVLFESRADDLVVGDNNFASDVFLVDRTLGTVEIVSLATGGTQAQGQSEYPSISEDGRFVAFLSSASNLSAGDVNNDFDVFVRDRQLGVTTLVSAGMTGVAANLGSNLPCISGNGRYVAFESLATNLVPGDTNGCYDVFIRDLSMATTARASVSTGGGEGDEESAFASISSDGRYVTFASLATSLVRGDTNNVHDIFIHDSMLGTTDRVSVGRGGVESDSRSFYGKVSTDGRFVAFNSTATNLVLGLPTGYENVYVRDLDLRMTTVMSRGLNGLEGNGSSSKPSITSGGRYVVFESTASNLVSGDSNGWPDIFIHDRDAAGFSSMCNPGIDGVRACPCGNAPSSADRGCDNSMTTSGAVLSASGVAYLSQDSLVFTTSGEKPTATSVLLQGTSVTVSGVVYGQGVRCVGGALKRLFTKTASGGSITAPNFGAGDPTVSARSAAKGSPISAGQSRWYLVFYRDPIVLGGCPVSSTFNATQTGQVTWSP
jgi:Tol biopolymer transport system component